VKGQTQVITVTVKTQDGAASSVVGTNLYFTAQDDKGTVVIAKLSTDGIVVKDGPGGIFTVTLTSTDTELAPGRYRYDIWVEFPVSPPVRNPVVKAADMIIEDAITQFA